MNSFLIIQTASIGDVILATGVAEKIHSFFPKADVDFVVRKGCESVLENHPFVRNVLIYDKSQFKALHLRTLTLKIRRQKYDCVVNIHRYGSSAIMTALSSAKYKTGFNKSPLWFLYDKVVKHSIGDGTHEVVRNAKLIEDISNNGVVFPKLYPSDSDFRTVSKYKERDYVCIAPASKWFTKQFTKEKWIELIKRIHPSDYIYLIGGIEDVGFCEDIHLSAGRNHISNLAGNLTFLQTAALMKDARMNYVNDSAPLHIASAMNAPVTAIFISTVPEFGFYPLSDITSIVQTHQKLECRPCGLHGHNKCPKGHFQCAETIKVESVL
ncbi:MAG: glycosyltransferase family 9 protein [Bacteroidetes bacterium]|nr:glycosyltransferase family 9 protein [Bacteroidota bacterium]